ncbi:MAG: LPS export ABC transporter ATP-binding protein [Thermoguttaceae bacterium]|nr:LPS export ABC transporter ATP-binding protein [Thermoguttaceae bacterium]MBQ9799209.1 LPS export ABC transporter ATP-binding protein [Thermoguttaceae bacterium]
MTTERNRWNWTPTSNVSRRGCASERAVVLKAEGLVKIYGKRRVVDGVSFEVREGEVVGLLGANGAGKTTSFRMSCGLIPANEGKITLNGLDVTSWPMYRRAREGRLGYLPQDRSVFGTLTTEQNLIAAMEFLGYSRAEQKIALEESLEKFNLKHIRLTKVGMGGSGGLSGGERRRLEIARALLAKPRILLLDEPFANVDPITVEGIQEVVRQLADEGIAILITDHQVDETLAITDRSYIVNSGKVLCSGTPLEVLSNPAAVERYFGAKAEFSRKRILQKLGIREEDAPFPSISRTREDFDDWPTSQNTREPEPAPRRASLTLNRRNDGPPRKTPSPLENRTPNRFAEKMGGLFKKKR